MNTAMAKEELEKILDQAVQDVTERTAGVRLHQDDQSPGEDLCTVQITFDKGFHTCLTLCADTGLLYRMACNSFHEESVTSEDLEEFSKEYFNFQALGSNPPPLGGQALAAFPSSRKCGKIPH